MKRLLAALLVCLALCGVCAVGACAAGGFDPNAVRRCIFLVDTNPAMGFGHSAMVLVDQNRSGMLLSYQIGGLLQAALSAAQLRQFLGDGIIPKEIAVARFQFNRTLEFDVLPEEGRRMYDHASTHEFQPFFMYASFYYSIIPYRDNCLTFVHSVMAAGSSKYKFLYPFGAPIFAFSALKWRLRLRRIPYTVSYPG